MSEYCRFCGEDVTLRSHMCIGGIQARQSENALMQMNAHPKPEAPKATLQLSPFENSLFDALVAAHQPKPEPPPAEAPGAREWIIPAEWQTDGQKYNASDVVKVVLKSDYERLERELTDTKSVLAGVEEQALKNSNYDDWRVAQVEKQLTQARAELAELKAKPSTFIKLDETTEAFMQTHAYKDLVIDYRTRLTQARAELAEFKEIAEDQKVQQLVTSDLLSQERARNAGLVEALERLQNKMLATLDNVDDWFENCQDGASIAREALAKFGGEK